jgi:hypothetical protein
MTTPSSVKAIREMRINSWEELNKALFVDSWDDSIGRYRASCCFRGLSHATFDLGSSISRAAGYYFPLEQALLRNFRKYAHGSLQEARSDLFWLAVGQHHGLPTRLLDWTFSPFVAAHFATDNPSHASDDGIVWSVDYVKARDLLPPALKTTIEAEHGMSVFTVDLLETCAPTLEALEGLETGEPFLLFVEPPSLDDRIVNQVALFSMMSRVSASLDDWIVHHPEAVRRVVIAASAKQEIRDKLDEVGVTERVLFPGLDGLAAWLKRYYGPALSSSAPVG